VQSKATQDSLAHIQALLTLLQLHQYQELCYQPYLYAEVLEELESSPSETDATIAGAGWIFQTLVGGTASVIGGGKFGIISCWG